MTLPLIVVPAIAMLKPADSGPGVVSALLSAASGNGEANVAPADESDASDFNAVEDQFDAMFGESSDENHELETGEQVFHEDVGESLVDDFVADFGTSATSRSPQGTASNVSVEPLLEKLQQLGASKTVWFSPDGATVGFVAFFPTGPGTVSYRFEAMAKSRAEAVRDVIRQAAEWQETSQR